MEEQQSAVGRASLLHPMGATMAPVLFDEYVMVDWSASSRPTTGTDSIWIARVDPEIGVVALENPSTRRRAESVVHEMLHAAVERRVLLGVDVPLGYPAGFAACVARAGLAPRPGWTAVWRTIADGLDDRDDNRNDRFALAARLNELVGEGPGPFWGCPAAAAGPSLAARKVHRFPVATSSGLLEEYRVAERRSRTMGRRPLSVWQTAYTGSVGSQALTAIPVLDRLVRHPVLGDRVEVWPFTTGFVADPTGGRPDTVVLAEIWPSGFDLDLGRHPVKDAAQVIGTCETLAALDAAGELAELFVPDLDDHERDLAVREEAWILGVR